MPASNPIRHIKKTAAAAQTALVVRKPLSDIPNSLAPAHVEIIPSGISDSDPRS
jgi:hypothetical protein